MGTSTTIPPSGTTSDPVPSLYLSDTFYTWFNTTNDLINKVNPIEVYTIKSITGGHEVTFQKGGVNQLEGLTLDDLGNGNWQFGYVLPKDITGGHTWHQAHQFINGISGHIANSFNGRTGEIVGVNSISARLPVVSGGTGNVESAVFTVNLVSAATHGAMTLEAGDIPGSLAFATGPMGYILGATQGGTGPINFPVALFADSIVPDATQDALSIYGTIAGTAGTQPRVSIGDANTFKTDSMLHIDGTNAGLTAGGIHTVVNSTYGWDLKSDGAMGIAASAGVVIDVSQDTAAGDLVVQKATSVGGLPTAANTELFKVEHSGNVSIPIGIELLGTVKDQNSALADGAGYVLQSDASSKVEWKEISAGAIEARCNVASNVGPFGVGLGSSYSTARRNLTAANAIVYGYFRYSGTVYLVSDNDPTNTHLTQYQTYDGGSGHGYFCSATFIVPPGWWWYAGRFSGLEVGWSGGPTDVYEDIKPGDA